MRLRLPLLALSVLLAGPSSAADPQIETLAPLPRGIEESSGVAASRTQPGVLWTHNDSGGGARFYAITSGGELLAAYLLPGTRAEDLEDIALGSCPGKDAPCLFLADTGDNLEKRAWATVLIVPEPTAPKQPDARMVLTPKPHALRVRYPDGAHDVESIAFDPDGNLLLVSKGRTPPIRAYRVTRTDLAGAEATAARLGPLDVPTSPLFGGSATGAATSPSRERLVVRTYTALYFFRFGADGGLVPDGDLCPLGYIEPQGEGVDFLDERTLVLTSESRGKRRGSILRVSCP
jgi:hypothetical protein